MTWVNDDNIYTSCVDPMWGECDDDTGMDVQKLIYEPNTYSITRPSSLPDFLGFGGMGPKPSGIICVDGVHYLAEQNIVGKRSPRHDIECQHGSEAYILVSKDYGKT